MKEKYKTKNITSKENQQQQNIVLSVFLPSSLLRLILRRIFFAEAVGGRR